MRRSLQRHACLCCVEASCFDVEGEKEKGLRGGLRGENHVALGVGEDIVQEECPWNPGDVFSLYICEEGVDEVKVADDM